MVVVQVVVLVVVVMVEEEWSTTPRPQQPVVMVHPGETALAFYTARNPTDKWGQGIY